MAASLRGVSVTALMLGMAAPALAQEGGALDPITVVATKTEERAIDALAPVSTLRGPQIDQLMAGRPSELFLGMPGVSFEETARDPATAINIRGMQDFGRVAVVIDGARQNFTKLGHDGAGSFYLEPELLAGVDVVRGPVANVYGSGAIGGVVSFQTKDVADVLKPGERWGVLAHGLAGTNGTGGGQGLASLFAAVRVNPNIDFFVGGTHRATSDYTTGRNGTLPVASGAGPGRQIVNSGATVDTGISKLTLRPADGHEVKFGAILYQADWIHQNIPTAGSPTVRDSNLQNNTFTARWRYHKPEDRWFDFDGSAYFNQVKLDQVKIAPSSNSSYYGPLGNRSGYDIKTTGFDLHNTSRFETGPLRHAVTFGADYFKDDVTNVDPGGFGDGYNPNGKRTVGGAFAQLKSNYATWLEVVGGLRFDSYKLDGTNSTTGLPLTNDGDRLSPKITVGVTPLQWFTVYGSYAEGYRAPSVTETMVSSRHPGTGFSDFLFIPNPNLRPEIGKNKEIGVNIRHDGLFVPGDKLRIKANLYRNDVEDFIESNLFCDGTLGSCASISNWKSQYINVSQARIEGAEFEGNYDAGAWFLGLNAHRIRGTDLTQGDPLNKIPPDMVATTLGVRFWDRKVTASVRWAAYAAKTLADLPTGTAASDATRAYNLVNLYLSYQPTEDLIAGMSIENLLDEYYIRYTDELPSPGLTVKGSLKIRFGQKG